MNTSPPTDDRPFDQPALEDEWLAQERALRAEREHADGAHDDARLHSYRTIARALHEPLPHALPADFVAQVAQRVAATQIPQSAQTPFAAPFERIVIGLMIALFGLAIGTAVALSAATVLQPLGDTVRQAVVWGSNPWLMALAVCLATSTALQRLQRALSTHAHA